MKLSPTSKETIKELTSRVRGNKYPEEIKMLHDTKAVIFEGQEREFDNFLQSARNHSPLVRIHSRKIENGKWGIWID